MGKEIDTSQEKIANGSYTCENAQPHKYKGNLN